MAQKIITPANKNKKIKIKVETDFSVSRQFCVYTVNMNFRYKKMCDMI